MPPKKQATRMAAAVEAMKVMGFEPKLVRKAVNRLLKVYGNEWHFFEADAYKELLEELLRDQTNGDENGKASADKSKGEKCAETGGAGPSLSKDASQKKPSCENDTETSGAEPLSEALLPATDARGVKDTETSVAGPSINKDVSPQTDANDAESSGAGPSSSKVASVEDNPTGASEVETSEPVPSSSMGLLPCSNLEAVSRTIEPVPLLSMGLLPCSNLEAVSRTLQSNDDLDSSSNNEPLDTASHTQLPDANNCLIPTEEETQGPLIPTEGETQGRLLPTGGEPQGQQGPPVTPSVQQVNTLLTRRRRPYHGWVGCEDDDFVVQTEAPLPRVLRKMFILTVDSGKRKRKSRWDVAPEKM